MRRTVLENDVTGWATQYLDALSHVRPSHHKQVRPARER
jgi:trehalose 6-phosphate synthase